MSIIRSIISLFFLTAVVFASGLSDVKTVTHNLSLTFFGSSTCDECARIKQELLLPLKQRYSGAIELQLYDTESDSGIRALISFEKKFKTSTNAAQVLFFPDTFLTGFDDIMKYGSPMIEARVAVCAPIRRLPRLQSLPIRSICAVSCRRVL